MSENMPEPSAAPLMTVVVSRSPAHSGAGCSSAPSPTVSTSAVLSTPSARSVTDAFSDATCEPGADAEADRDGFGAWRVGMADDEDEWRSEAATAGARLRPHDEKKPPPDSTAGACAAVVASR